MDHIGSLSSDDITQIAVDVLGPDRSQTDPDTTEWTDPVDLAIVPRVRRHLDAGRLQQTRLRLETQVLSSQVPVEAVDHQDVSVSEIALDDFGGRAAGHPRRRRDTRMRL